MAQEGVPGSRSPLLTGYGDSMTLSLVSLLSQDISALWLLLKAQAGVRLADPCFSGTRQGCGDAAGGVWVETQGQAETGGVHC